MKDEASNRWKNYSEISLNFSKVILILLISYLVLVIIFSGPSKEKISQLIASLFPAVSMNATGNSQ